MRRKKGERGNEMPRLTKIDDILFPVTEGPIFAGIKGLPIQQLRGPDKKTGCIIRPR